MGEALEQHGHEVQYFGMEHEGRCVGNRINAYTSDMDFHGGSKLSKLTYPIKTIYSKEARVQLRKVLDDFKPDVCHLNNFNYQLTPSIILENDYTFTMTATGTYNFRFYVMDKPAGVYYLRLNFNIGVSDSKYPSVDSTLTKDPKK